MVAPGIVILAFTIFFFASAIIGLFVTPKGENRGIIHTMIITTAVCLWLFWLCTFMAQMNPLIGPQIKTEHVAKV